MVLLKATHQDVDNLVGSASLDKPYLVYSYNKGYLFLKDSYNLIKGKQVFLRWAGKEDKESVALVVINESRTKEIIQMCLAARENGMLKKVRINLYEHLQLVIGKMNRDIEIQKQISDLPNSLREPLSFHEIYLQDELERKQKAAEKAGMPLIDPDADEKKRFKLKYSYYEGKQRAILKYCLIDNRLTYSVYGLRGYATKLLIDYDLKKRFTNIDLILISRKTEGSDYWSNYFIPKGLTYLISGDVNREYFKQFKEDESKLNSDIEKALSFNTERINLLLKRIDKEQDLYLKKERNPKLINRVKADFTDKSNDALDYIAEFSGDSKVGKFFSNLKK